MLWGGVVPRRDACWEKQTGWSYPSCVTDKILGVSLSLTEALVGVWPANRGKCEKWLYYISAALNTRMCLVTYMFIICVVCLSVWKNNPTIDSLLSWEVLHNHFKCQANVYSILYIFLKCIIKWINTLTWHDCSRTLNHSRENGE